MKPSRFSFKHAMAAGALYVITATPLAAQVASAPAPARPQNNRAESLVVEIRSTGDQMRQAVGTFSDKIEAVQAAIDAAVAEIDSAAEQFRQAPTRATRLQLDNVVFTQLGLVEKALEEVLSQEGNIEQATIRLEQIVERARQSVQQEIKRKDEVIEQHDRRVKELERALSDLANRYAADLRADRPLPPQVDVNARELEAALIGTRLRAVNARKWQDRAKQWFEAIASHKTRLAHLKGENSLLFQQAQFQVTLIGEISEDRRIDAESVGIGEQVAESVSVLDAAQKEFNTLWAKFEATLANTPLVDPNADIAAGQTDSPQSTRGSQILLTYLSGNQTR